MSPRHAPSQPPLTLHDLLAMSRRDHARVMRSGHPLDLEALAESVYLGVDLSMPRLAQRLLWQTFAKTFHADPRTGQLRGWNVRLEQHGPDGPLVPMRDRKGRRLTFGHYRVRPAAGQRFPGGWRGSHYLDYAGAGNALTDPTRLVAAPLVAVNEGSSALLLGWEIGQVGCLRVPMPLYWALVKAGPLDHDVPPPRPGAAR